MTPITFETAVAPDHQLHYELPESLPVGCPVKVTVELIPQDALAAHYQPKTEIGRLALAARLAHLKAGGKLLGLGEINDEVRNRRGGVADSHE